MQSVVGRVGFVRIAKELVNVPLKSVNTGLEPGEGHVQFRVFQDASTQMNTHVFDQVALEFISQDQQSAQFSPGSCAQVEHSVGVFVRADGRLRVVQHALNVWFLVQLQTQGNGQPGNPHGQIGDGGLPPQDVSAVLVQGSFKWGLHEGRGDAVRRYTASTGTGCVTAQYAWPRGGSMLELSSILFGLDLSQGSVGLIPLTPDRYLHDGLEFLMNTTHTAATELPRDQELVLKVIPMPADCNANGDIFGGWVMAQVDLAGAVLPARRVNGRMATVAVNQFVFKQPVKVGDILSFFARITRVGNTSVTVQVEVYAERIRQQGVYLKVTEATLTYVAIDDEGRPRSIPPPA